MANPPSPSQNPAASSPPPAPASPSVELPIPDEKTEKAIEALNPFEVMKKRPAAPGSTQTAAAPIPAPISAEQPVPASREELIEQAAQSPATPFILPTQGAAESQVSNSTPPPPTPAPAPPPPTPAPKPAPSLPPTAPAPFKTAPVPPPKVPRPDSLPKAAALPLQPAKKRSRSGLLAVAGLLVIAALAAGGVYVLAVMGTRIPGVYPYVTGLPTDGMATAQQASGIVLNKTSYQQYGETNIKAQSEDGTPILPSDVGTTDPIANVATKVTADLPLRYAIQDKAIAGREGITIDNLTEVPLYISGQENGDWNINLPANVIQPFVQVPASDIKKTVLYPSIQPIPLPVILGAVKEETAYQKASGQKVAEYTYTLDTDIIKDWLPTDAAVDQLTAKIVYAWQSSLPLSTEVSGIISYQERSYQFSEAYTYGNWDEDFATTDTALSDLLHNTVTPEINTGETFVPQLGVPFIRVPNTLVDPSLLTNTDPIIPSGQSVDSVQPTITTIPPLPSVPAPEEAISRDTQRQADLADLQKALQQYKVQQGQYPATEGLVQVQASSTLFTALVGDYLQAMPVDPLQDTYWYEYQSDGHTYILRSVAENQDNSEAKPGKAFFYFELTGN